MGQITEDATGHIIVHRLSDRHMVRACLDGRDDVADYLAKSVLMVAQYTEPVAKETDICARAALQNVDADNVEVMVGNRERTCSPRVQSFPCV